jgi:hypothetical protein
LTCQIPKAEKNTETGKNKNLSFFVKQTRPLVVDVLQYNGNQIRVPLQPGE